MAYGATDEFGFKAVEKRVHVHDLHATMLHLMGIDHEKLDVSLQWTRLPPDRRTRQGDSGDHRLSEGIYSLDNPSADFIRGLDARIFADQTKRVMVRSS